MDDIKIAQIVLRCIDLTSLNKNDSTFKINELAKKGITPHGDVAALCVYPKFVEGLKEHTDLKIATVLNFPESKDSIAKIKTDIEETLQNGADELDIVFPYQDFLNKNYKNVDEFLMMLKSLNKSITTKIILETSELKKLTTIVDATKLCLDAGAHFIKTSTGKKEGGATPEVANIILETIAKHHKKAGFKASGGIKTLEEARKYVIIADAIMGKRWLKPSNFRIGASSLLGDVLQCLSKT